MTEQSETKRAAMIRDILTRIHDSAVYVPISYSRTKAVYRTSLSGVGFRVSQYEIPFEDMFFKNAQIRRETPNAAADSETGSSFLSRFLSGYR